MFRITTAGKSHPGLRRENNEDSLLVLPDRGLFAVADGMGGHAAGEVASGMVVSILEQTCGGAEAGDDGLDPDQLLTGALVDANRQIHDQGVENPAQRGMGSTATALLIGDDDCYTIGHVGDSRAYRFFDGELTQLTTDHSLVQEQKDLGLLREEDAATHRLKNVITRSIGGRDEVEVDIVRGRCSEGDIFLLCSDGFSNEVTSGEIVELLGGPETLEERADRCIELANQKDGTDNITVVLVEVSSAADGDSAEDVPDRADEAAQTVVMDRPADPPKKKGGKGCLGLFTFVFLLMAFGLTALAAALTLF